MYISLASRDSVSSHVSLVRCACFVVYVPHVVFRHACSVMRVPSVVVRRASSVGRVPSAMFRHAFLSCPIC